MDAASPPCDGTGFAGCEPSDGADPLGDDAGGPRSVTIHLSEASRNQLDVLFVIDNSSGMKPAQDQLKEAMPALQATFTELAGKGIHADLHLGVITTDFGAGAGGVPGCLPSPGSYHGTLQNVGAAADPGCLPPNGSFVAYDFAKGGANNLPKGQDLGTTLGCMVAVGESGCGFVHTLEAARAALADGQPENAGFLRKDALLTVLFLTRHDDCSAPPASDLFDPHKIKQYGFESTYRCARFGVTCGGKAPPYRDSGGPLAGCAPAPNPGGKGPGLLFDVSRFTDVFARPAAQGGLKADPNDVVLIALDGPNTGFSVALDSAYSQLDACAPLNEGANPPCVPTLQATCTTAGTPVLAGEPAVRLEAVLKTVAHHETASVCGLDYGNTVQTLATLIVSSVGGGCVSVALPDPKRPDCQVELTEQTPGGPKTTVLAACGAPGAGFPCWRIEVKPQCATASPQGVGLTVDWNGAAPPMGADVIATCVTG